MPGQSDVCVFETMQRQLYVGMRCVDVAAVRKSRTSWVTALSRGQTVSHEPRAIVL